MAVDEAVSTADNSSARTFKQFSEKFKMFDGKFLEKFPAAIQKEGVEKEFGQSGLKKLLLKAGEGWDLPKPGDEVQVHYIGRFEDGTKFDSSYERNAPFSFMLGRGEVMKGWDRGIASMKKREIALLTIPPDLAYGSAGAQPLIPPNATLKYEVELLSWSSITDVLRDGGVIKKTVSEGQKWDVPKESDEVTVRFEAKLMDGTFIERTPPEGVTFTPRDGCFCPAISKAVRAMKSGEKATLTVTAQYGFAEKGRPATAQGAAVPAYAGLLIDIEVVSWNTVDDITDDRRVVKKVLVAGQGLLRPNEGSVVRVKYEGKLADGTVFERRGYGEDDLHEFILEEEQVVSGLDRAIMAMRQGEVAEVSIAPDYGYGSVEVEKDLAVVPADSQLVYEVELVTFTRDKEIADMTTAEKLEAASSKKEDGNALFKTGNYWRASKKYEKAVKYIDYDMKFSDDEKKTSRQLKVACYLNNAACKLKLGMFNESVSLSTKVLDIEAGNLKALYRRAQAYLATADIDLADKDLTKMISIDPQNREAKLLQQELKKRGSEYDKQEAKFYNNMMAKLKL